MRATVITLADRRPVPRVSITPQDVVLIVGKRGNGKSTAAKAICGELMRIEQPIAVYDLHDEYSELGQASGGVTLGPLTQRATVAELVERPELLDAHPLALAIIPDKMPKQAAADFATLLAGIENTGNVCLLLEELGVWAGHAEELVNYAATQSRHWGDGVPLVLVAQRAVQIPKTARTQATQLISFRQDDPADLAALAEIAGQPFADDVKRLRRGEFRHWRDDAAPAAPKEK